MTGYLIDLGITTLGVLLAQGLYTLVFVLFRANKYEDQLAKKIAKEVKNEQGQYTVHRGI